MGEGPVPVWGRGMQAEKGWPAWDEGNSSAIGAVQNWLSGHLLRRHRVYCLCLCSVMLRIDITPCKSGVHHVELSPEADDLELDPERFEDLHVTARLDCHRDRILVAMDVRGVATLTCDRTLREYQQPLEGSYRILFGPEHMVGADGEHFDEVRPLHPSDREIDVTDLVRDTLLLAIPQRKVAPGAEQEDLPMEFGPAEPAGEKEASDIDPRWEALRKLRDNREGAGN